MSRDKAQTQHLPFALRQVMTIFLIREPNKATGWTKKKKRRFDGHLEGDRGN